MNVRVLAGLLAAAALLLASACSLASGTSDDDRSSPTPAVTEPVATASAAPGTPATNRPLPTSPGGAPPLATPVAPTPAGDRIEVLAPIDGLDVAVLESFPPRYVLNLRAGLPSGCARQGRYDLTRLGTTLTVRVWNTMPVGRVACTAIYGTYELRIDLGTDFQRGVQYTVEVNGRTTSFTAQ